MCIIRDYFSLCLCIGVLATVLVPSCWVFWVSKVGFAGLHFPRSLQRSLLETDSIVVAQFMFTLLELAFHFLFAIEGYFCV